MTKVSFENRTVIVTGAGGALGRTYAIDIAGRGGRVIVNDLGGSAEGFGSSNESADQVVAEIRTAGGEAVASYDDVSTSDGAKRIVETALDHFGRIDALINNAGNIRNAWLEDFTDENRDAVIATHLIGSFNMTRAVWPGMKAQGYGRIVFASSCAGMLGNCTQAAYGAAKAGITGLMNVASQEGRAHGILCNALVPNAVSRMADNMDYTAMKDIEPYAAAVYHAMDPVYTTGLVVFLASEACTSTHSIYSSLGGRYARMFIGVTEGWQGVRGQPSTADDVADHFDQISDVSRGFEIPESLIDEFRIVAGQQKETA